MLRSLRRPKRLVLALLGVGLLALFVMAGSVNPHQSMLGSPDGPIWFALLLSFFPAMSIWVAARKGLIAYQPEEVTFLFPAPISPRALLLGHLLGASVKASSAGLFFALFLRPGATPFGWALFCYALYMTCIVVLQVFVDLRFLRLPPAVRARRSAALGLALLGAAAAALLAAWLADGGRMSSALLRYLVAPVQPMLQLFLHPSLAESGPRLAAILAVLAGMLVLILARPPDVRDAAHATSQRVAEMRKRALSGRPLADTLKQSTSGRVLPMLPRWGGAGVHTWRQLSILRRSRKSFVLLVFVALMLGWLPLLTGEDLDLRQAAGTMMAVLVLAGPMYVQCDFRSDYDCLAWMRSLPTAPGVLAAGQMLSSALVLFGLQLLLCGWILVVARGTEWLAWLGALLALPVFNLLQLSVWNAAYLLVPLRVVKSEGPPALTHLLRLWVVNLAVFLTLGISLAVAAVPGVLAWFALGPWLGLMDEGPALYVLAGGLSAAALVGVTAVSVWLVGRVFLRVDPAQDLSG